MRSFSPFLLLSMLVLHQTVVTRAEKCSLCADGMPPSDPTKRVGVTDPFPLETCGDLANVLTILDVDSKECQGARSLSAFCGCSVPDNACTVCPDGFTMTLPLQQLDGLIDFDRVAAIVPDVTCELMESVLNRMNNTAQKCLEATYIVELRDICGCKDPQDEAETE